jgi:hypothetical protein
MFSFGLDKFRGGLFYRLIRVLPTGLDDEKIGGLAFTFSPYSGPGAYLSVESGGDFCCRICEATAKGLFLRLEGNC